MGEVWGMLESTSKDAGLCWSALSNGVEIISGSEGSHALKVVGVYCLRWCETGNEVYPHAILLTDGDPRSRCGAGDVERREPHDRPGESMARTSMDVLLEDST